MTATYNGDSSNPKSESPVLTQAVNQATISIALTSAPNPSPLGKSVKFTAAVTSNGRMPTGTITFSCNGSTFGMGGINGAHEAVFSTSSLPASSDLVTASYAGTSDYSAANGSVTQVVNATTTTLGSSVNPSSYGQTGCDLNRASNDDRHNDSNGNRDFQEWKHNPWKRELERQRSCDPDDVKTAARFELAYCYLQRG